MGSAPATVAPPPNLTGKQAKPRALFPALAATAIAGAILGIGGTIGLRFFGGSHFSGVDSSERIAALTHESMRSRASRMPPPPPPAPRWRRSKPAPRQRKAPQAKPRSWQIRHRPMRKRPSRRGRRNKSPRPVRRQRLPISDHLKRELEPSSKSSLRSKRRSPRRRRISAHDKIARMPRPEKARAPKRSRLSPKACCKSWIAASNLRANSRRSKTLVSARRLSRRCARVPESTVSTEPQLTARFATLVPGIIESESAKQASEDESFLDRVTRHAKGLVHIRRVGDTEAPGVEGFVERIEKALAEHDLETAYKTWKQLPGTATTQSQSWGEAAKARLDALNAARAIEADAVAVLGKPKS